MITMAIGRKTLRWKKVRIVLLNVLAAHCVNLYSVEKMETAQNVL